MQIRTDPRRRLRQYDELPGAEPEAAFPLPEDLSILSDAELGELLEQAIGAFDDARDGDLSPDAIGRLGELRDAVRALRTESDRRVQAASERAAALDEMDAEIHPPETDPDATSTEPEADDDDDEEDAPEQPESDENEEPVPVAAGGRPANPSRVARPPLREVARRAPAPATRPGRRDDLVTITAAADLPGISPGSRIDTTKIAEAMHAKARLLPNHSARSPIATVSYPKNLPTITAGMDLAAIKGLLDEVRHFDTLEGLTAAGGWCGPLTPLYNLFRLDTAAGLFDLPTVNIARAGISVPDPLLMPSSTGPLGFAWDSATDADAVNGVALSNLVLTSNVVTVDTGAAHHLAVGDCFQITTNTAAFVDLNGHTLTVKAVTDADTLTADFTHANMTTGAATGTLNPTKCCIRIPCPSWTDYVLVANGVCVTHGNLADRSFPELTREYISMVMNAHRITMSMAALKIVDDAANNGGAAINTPEAGSVWSSWWNALDLVGELFRETYRMGDDAALEVIVPQWLDDLLRADLTTRANGLDPTGVTDQKIAAEYGIRGFRPQLVSHYQGITAATAWPSTINALVMAPGTFVRGTGGSIDLGVVRDSTLNATNDFTAAWTEEFWLVAQLGPDPMEFQVTVPALGCNTANCA